MPGWRDEATVALLERDGWQGPRDFLAECAWCGMPFWNRADAGSGRRIYCSVECKHRKWYWYHRASVGRTRINRIALESYRRCRRKERREEAA